MKRIFHSLSLGFFLTLQGCYSHSVIPVEGAPMGADVRARISATEADRLQEVLGREYRVLRGEVVAEEPGSLLLEVPAVVGASGQRLNQRVTIPKPEILELEVRELDRWRTAGLVAALAAVGGYLVAAQFGDEDASDTSSPPRGGGEQNVLLLRWAW